MWWCHHSDTEECVNFQHFSVLIFITVSINRYNPNPRILWGPQWLLRVLRCSKHLANCYFIKTFVPKMHFLLTSSSCNFCFVWWDKETIWGRFWHSIILLIWNSGSQGTRCVHNLNAVNFKPEAPRDEQCLIHHPLLNSTHKVGGSQWRIPCHVGHASCL